MNAAVAVVLSELDGIYTLKEENGTALKVFLGGKVLALLVDSFDKSLFTGCSASLLAL